MAGAGKRNFRDRRKEIAIRDSDFIEELAGLIPQLSSVSQMKDWNEKSTQAADSCRRLRNELQIISKISKGLAFRSISALWYKDCDLDAKTSEIVFENDEARFKRLIAELHYFDGRLRVLSHLVSADSKIDVPGRIMLTKTICYMRAKYGAESPPPQDGSDTDLCFIIEIACEKAGTEGPSRSAIEDWQRNEVPRVVKGSVHRK